MSEYFKRLYNKEEEFLDEFYEAASEAAKILDGEWKPNPHCDDDVRKSQRYFLSTGELNKLVFESAIVYHDENGFSSVQIHFKSLSGIVKVRVKKVDGTLVGEKLTDKSKD